MPESIMSLFDYLEPIEIRAERIIDERLKDDPDPRTSIHNRIVTLKQHKTNMSPNSSGAYAIDPETGEVMEADIRILSLEKDNSGELAEKDKKTPKEVRATKTRKAYDKSEAVNTGIPRHARKKKRKSSLIDND